jgi:Cft2 family RNA processing exonuclease
MELTLLGPRGDHAAVCLHLNVDGTGLLLDCGLDPSRDGWGGLPDLGPLDIAPEATPVDWILLSHAHLDHMGALPEIARRWPAAGILCTRATWELTRLQLCRHAALWAEAFELGGLADYPLFTAADVQDLAQRVRFIERGERLRLEGGWAPDPVPVTAYDAGHILGSVGWLIEGAGKRLFYTGDTCGRPQSVIQGAVYPPEAEILVSESTVAFSERHDGIARRDEIEALAQAIREVAGLGGSLLLPAFNMGRAQEALFILHSLKRKGRIPALPVVLGRSAWEIAMLYDRFAAGDRRLLPDFLFRETLVDIFDGGELEPLEHGSSRIYLVPSGMLGQDSQSWHLAKRLLPHPLHGIFFVGHTAGRSQGRRVLEATPCSDVDFAGEAVPRHARVESFLLPSHSSRGELLELAGRLRPERLAVLPGRKDGAEILAAAAAGALPGLQVELPRPGSTIDLTGR